MDLDSYPPFARILAPIEISRGCPWGCTYCQTPRLFGSCMRHRSIPIIAKYARRHKDIRFTSPNSLAYGSDGRRPRLEKVEALLKALAEQKKPIYFGTFPSEVRPEFVSPAALELIVKYCANKSLSLGGQSGSPAVLRSIGRGHGRDEIEAACELALDYGLAAAGGSDLRPAHGVGGGSAHDPRPGKMDRGQRRQSAGASLHAPAGNAPGGNAARASGRGRGGVPGQAGPGGTPDRHLVGREQDRLTSDGRIA